MRSSALHVRRRPVAAFRTGRFRHVAVAIVAVVTAAMALSGCAGATQGSAGGTISNGELTSAPGFDAGSRVFTVSALQPLSGALSPAGLAVASGMKVYFDQANAKGGIAGKYKVKFQAEDTQYNPQVAVPLYNSIKDETAMFSGILGTTILQGLQPLIEKDQIPSVVDSSSAKFVNSTYLLPWGAPTQINMVNLASYAVEKLGKKDAVFCSVSTTDDFGAENRDGIDFAMNRLGVNYQGDQQLNRGQTEFTPQVQSLKSKGCEVVFYGATTGQLTGVISAAVQLGFDAQFLGQNTTYDPSFATSPIAPYLEKHLLTTMMGVAWNSNVPGQVALREGIDQYAKGLNPSHYTQIGYSHAMFTEAVLELAVKNGDVSRAGILKATQTLGPFDYQGMLPTFVYSAPKERKPALISGIYRVDPSVPMGLAPVDTEYTSPLAEEYKLPA